MRGRHRRINSIEIRPASCIKQILVRAKPAASGAGRVSAGCIGLPAPFAAGPALPGSGPAVGSVGCAYVFATGTGIPGIFTLTEPRWLRLVK